MVSSGKNAADTGGDGRCLIITAGMNANLMAGRPTPIKALLRETNGK